MTDVHAGFQCTVTGPNGQTYEAMLQRLDGPESCIAVLYIEPFQAEAAGVEPYEQEVYVADPGNGAAVYTLSYTDEQAQRVTKFAYRWLRSVGQPAGGL